MSQSRLLPLTYFNPKQEVRLSAYADTIVLEQENGSRIIRAIRFGGYPEMVRAMSDAIYGGAAIEARIGEETCLLMSEAKRYTRQITHDGVYAEAVLLAKDGEQESEEPQEGMDLPPRKVVIFCPQGDRNRLFQEVDRKTAVPLIPAFRDYLLDELTRRGILSQLTVISLREKLEAWVLRCEKEDANIVQVVEDGLRSGLIAIPGTVKDPDGFDRVENVTGYLNTFGVTVAERIRDLFKPLFDPAREPLSPELLEINDFIREHAGYPLYDAQLAVAESVKRQLQKDKFAFIVAECGSGKTKIGAAALAAALYRPGRKTFNLILCPAHVTGKWVREIGETLPNTVGAVVGGIAELDRLYRAYAQGNKSVFAVLSKEKARDGYMRRPAVIWNRRRSFRCPSCMETIQVSISEDGVQYLERASQFFFRGENKKNHACPQCGTSLWTAVNPGERTDWIKIGGYGWVFRPLAAQHLEKTKCEGVLQKLEEMIDQPDRAFPTVGACRRFPLSSYIKRYYRGKIDGAIIDELHEYNNDSGQGDAMGEIFSAARKVIGMTATLINGYSSGIFHLLYRTMPAAMLRDGKRYSSPGDFNSEYGVVETSYEEIDAAYSANRRSSRTGARTKQLPGVSPLVYSRFLLEKAAFLTLADMGKELPDYEEIPVPLEMEEPVAQEYARVEKCLVDVLRQDRRAAQKILSTYLNLLTIYPDQPYGQEPVLHPVTGTEIVVPKDRGSFETLGAKERAVLDIVRRKIEAGEKVLIFTSWVRADSQRKLLTLLTDQGFQAEILSDKVRTVAREEWVQKRLAAGLQVLITNPTLVETGLDLNAFTTLIFFSLGYKLFTLRQASRRSWRINQTAPKVEVYLLYYRDTMQQKAMKLMASKLAVAGIIEGNFSEEGLSAMSDVQDMVSQMAKELMLGIRDNVEDIAASFQRMAIINPGRIPVEAKKTEPQRSAPISVPHRGCGPDRLAQYLAILTREKAARRKKPNPVAEDQLTLFDFVA